MVVVHVRAAAAAAAVFWSVVVFLDEAVSLE